MRSVARFAACVLAGVMSLPSVVASVAAAEAVMTNVQVIEMVAAGLDEDLVIAAVRGSSSDFDTSTSGLIALQSAGVPKPVIAAMITRAAANKVIANAGPARGPAATELSLDSPDPMVPHGPGVYMLHASGYDGRMRRIEPTIVDLESSGGGLVGFATMGVLGGEKRANLPGRQALVSTQQPSPEFYVFFDESVPPELLRATRSVWVSGGGAAISSPDSLQLIKAKDEKRHRELKIGEKLKEKHEIAHSWEYVRPGVYRMTVRSLLQPGSYAFVQSLEANDGKGGNTARVFDFQVSKR